jgi:hypothetical protein
MYEMKWENLKSMLCPYCSKALTEDLEVRCTECYFHIDKDRFKSIVEHRGFPNRNIVKLKWQNLKDDRCSVDAHFLKPNVEGKYDVLKCSNSECTFRIRADRLAEIVADPKHEANRFYKPKEENLYGSN